MWRLPARPGRTHAHTRRLAAAALTLTGCATATTAEQGSPPAGHVDIARLPEQPAHDADLPLDPPAGPVDRDDPAAVSVALIVAGLAEQGLEVVDLGVELLAANLASARVRIAATHRTELAGAPHTSVYELDLTRDPGGAWRLVGFRQAQ